MKVFIALVFATFIFFSCLPIRAEELSLFPKDIPSRVHYMRPPETSLQAAYTVLNKVFASDWTKSVGLFKDAVSVDPYLWHDLQEMEPFKSDPGAKVTTMSPDGKRSEGKAFRSDRSLDDLEKYLRERMLSKGTVTIRPPDLAELDAYWSVIGWDLQNPLFVVEVNLQEKYILEFDGHGATVGNVVTLTKSTDRK